MIFEFKENNIKVNSTHNKTFLFEKESCLENKGLNCILSKYNLINQIWA